VIKAEYYIRDLKMIRKEKTRKEDTSQRISDYASNFVLTTHSSEKVS
jgi:hypothetical protein